VLSFLFSKALSSVAVKLQGRNSKQTAYAPVNDAARKAGCQHCIFLSRSKSLLMPAMTGSALCLDLNSSFSLQPMKGAKQ